MAIQNQVLNIYLLVEKGCIQLIKEILDSMQAKLYFVFSSLLSHILVRRKIPLNGATIISIILLSREDCRLSSLCFCFNKSSSSLFLLLAGEAFVTFIASSIWLPSCSTRASPLQPFLWPTPKALQILRMCGKVVLGQFLNK